MTTKTKGNPHGLTARQIGDLPLDDGTCGICCRPTNSPYRALVAGELRYGCVARCHWPHLIKPSTSASFHADYHRKLGQKPGAPKGAR